MESPFLQVNISSFCKMHPVEFHVLTLGTNQKNHSTQLTQLGKLSLIVNYLTEIGALKSTGGESTFKIDKVDTEDLKQFVVCY